MLDRPPALPQVGSLAAPGRPSWFPLRCASPIPSPQTYMVEEILRLFRQWQATTGRKKWGIFRPNHPLHPFNPYRAAHHQLAEEGGCSRPPH